jgi:hypothetical protein
MNKKEMSAKEVKLIDGECVLLQIDHVHEQRQVFVRLTPILILGLVRTSSWGSLGHDAIYLWQEVKTDKLGSTQYAYLGDITLCSILKSNGPISIGITLANNLSPEAKSEALARQKKLLKNLSACVKSGVVLNSVKHDEGFVCQPS